MKNELSVGVVAFAAAGLMARLIFAQAAQTTRTWDAEGAGSNWSTAGNWSADDAPDGTSEAALFTNHPVGQTKLTPNLSADVTIGQLQYSATAPGYTVTGTGPAQLFLSPAASFGGVGVVVAGGAANQIISNAEVEFLSSQTWDIGGTTTLTVTGIIEDDSVIDYGLTKNGTGTLVFSGDVRYDGVTVLNAGAMVLSFNNTSMLSAVILNGGVLRATTSAGALGTSSTRNTITLAGGALELANNTGLTFGSTSRITTVTGNATIRSDRLSAGAGVTHTLGTLSIGAQTLTVTPGGFVSSGTAANAFGATTLTGNATVNVINGGTANAQLTLGAVGQSGGTRSLTKTGTGALRLNGAASYTGGTTLSQGAITLGIANALGSGGFNFAGGTLNGNNFADSSIGVLALTANSTLALTAGGSAATLTFAGVSGTANGILTITGWSGSPGGLGTNDKIIFSGGTTPNADFLQHIRFVLSDGNTYPGALGTGGELIPAVVPGPISFTGTEHLGNPTDTSIAINVVPGANATIYYEYGTTSGVYTSQTTPVAALAGQPCEVVLAGLQPDTRYFYRMQYEAAASPGNWIVRSQYQFQTARPAGNTYTFIVTSDSHINLQLGTLSQWQTALDMIAADRPDFMVDLGDTFAMDNGTTAVASESAADQVYLFQRAGNILGRATHSVPLFLAMGNHENEEGWNFDDVNPLPIWGMKARKRYYPLPSPLTAPAFYATNPDPVTANLVTPPNSHIVGSDQFREDYYAWTWGDALFVVFDPFQYTMQNPHGASAGEGGDDPAVGDRWNWTMGIQQHQWLNNVLSTSTAKYKFLFAHHMLGGTENYVRGGAEPAHQFEWGGANADGTWGWDTRRPAAAGWIKPVHQMMIDYGVTAFFHGHDHQFAYEVRDGKVYQAVPAASQGTTSGFGSYTTSPYVLNTSANSGYLRVTISPSQALLEYVKTTGTVGQIQYSYTMAPVAGPSHVITASAGVNGSISPSGNVNVPEGANQNFVITPNPGYAVADVLVNGSSVGAVTSHQFTNVTANQTIAASFVPLAVMVPNVFGFTPVAAANALGSVGLVVGATNSLPHASVPIGSVIAQSPASGSTVYAGTTVALTSSAGVAVPSVAGLAESVATSTLTTAGFIVTTSTQPSTSVANGSVISQTPSGGTAANGGSTVALVISSGPPANITLANVQSAQNTTAGTFVDLAYTVPNISGSPLVLVVYGGAEAGTTNLALPTGATFHGAVMNVAAQHRTPATGFNAGSGLYWLPVTPNEAGTIRLSFTGSAEERAVGAVTLVGAALTGPEVVEVATGTAALTDQITTLSPNAMVISTATQGNPDALTATGTGHVLDVSTALPSSRTVAGHSEVVTPSSRTLGFSGTINRIAMTLASFPVAGGPANTPPQVSLTAPANQATGIGTSTVLSATVTDTDATTVTFYGRKTVPVIPGPDFVIGTLPDTQFYSENSGGNLAQIFSAQTNWYADNRVALNLAFISHMGDMVQSNDNGTNNSEWNIADLAMRIIEDPLRTGLPYGIPWGGAPGNHDQTTNGQVNAPNLKWNQFFGAARWAGRPYFGGTFSPTNNSNSYYLFEASGLEFLVIHLDYTTSAGVSQAVIDWADGLMKALPHRRVIVASHWILDLPPASPVPASSPFGGPGQRFFDEFKDNPNFFLMLSGHQHGEGRRTDVFNGRTVYSVLQDYQARTNGGNGWLRYFVFSPANNTITAKTYSPTLGQSETDTEATSSPLNQASEFMLTYNMQSAVAPWTTLVTVTVPAGGGAIQYNWTGLDLGSTYEWYVAASDGVTTTTSPARVFSTASSQTLTTITVSPASTSVPANGTQAFTAQARDQFGTLLSPQPVFTWSTTVGGTIDATGLFTAGSSAGGPFTVAAAVGSINGNASVTVTPVNAAPTVATAAGAAPSPVNGTTTALSALGADDGGEPALTYTWATTGTPPAAVTFNANGTNAAKTVTATFARAGSYSFQVTIRDAGNLTVTSAVSVIVSQTLTSISVTPASASVVIGGTQVFAGTSRDQFNQALSPQPALVWSVTGGGTMSAAGLFSAGALPGGPFTVTATSSPVSGTASVTVTPAVPPVAVAYVQGAGVTGQTATTTIAQSFTAANSLGNLIVAAVTWDGTATVSCSDSQANTYVVATSQYDSTGNQTVAICYAPNSKAGSNTVTATFSTPSTWRRMLIHEYRGLATTNPVDVVAKNAATGTTAANAITSTAAVTTVAGDLIFGAVVDDAGTTSITAGTGFTQRLSVTSADFASEDLVQTAAGSIAATHTFGTAHRYVALLVAFKPGGPPNAAPTVATPAAAMPSPIVGTTTALSALGADDAGEAALTYTWNTTGTPPAPVTFSTNGTNAAKSTVATFSRAGSYSLQVTIRDTGNLTVMSNVGVTVSQTMTSITVSPATASVVTSATQAFAASALDQFAQALAPQPAFTWNVTGGGTINASGLFTAGSTVGGPFTVTATSGLVNGAANVTVTAPSAVIAYVQGASVTYPGGDSGITESRAFTSANLAGSLLVVAVSWDGTATMSCADTQGNTYTVAVMRYDSTGNQTLAICYAANSRAGANTVTATFSSASSWRRMLIHEYSGAALVNPVDVVAGNVATGTTAANAITSTAAVTTVPGDLIFGAAVDDAGSTSITAGTGFAQRLSVSSNDLASEDRIQPVAGSVAATHTFGAAHRYLAVMVAFKRQ